MVNPMHVWTKGDAPSLDTEIMNNLEENAYNGAFFAMNYNPPDATQTTSGFMSPTDKTKLDGIAVQATKNQADSYLLNRTNHTGTQAISTITGVVPIAQLPTGMTSLTVALGNHTHSAATTIQNGFMSAADKVKLNSIIPQTAPIISVTDPADPTNLQAQFDALIAKLKTSGIFL